jgi:LacI family transcriptional regulator, galactose operon repressor
MSNIHDVARAAKVSAMTVSRFFNAPAKLSAATRHRVEAAIKQTHYFPNAAARSLIVGRTDSIALIVGDITNPFFTTVARGVEDRAQQSNLALIICNSDETLAKEKQYVELLLRRRIDGIILAPSHLGADHLAALIRKRTPAVLLDRPSSEVPFDVVRGDSKKAAFELTQHLISQGYQRIAFVGGPPDNSALQDRVAGYRRALRAARRKARVHLGSYTEASGLELMRRLLAETSRDQWPDAVLAANNHVAIGVIRALKEHRLRIPQDIGLASFEEVEASSWRSPFFTAAVQPAYDLGWKAADRLVQRIANYEAPAAELVLPFTLHTRASTRGPQSG